MHNHKHYLSFFLIIRFNRLISYIMCMQNQYLNEIVTLRHACISMLRKSVCYNYAQLLMMAYGNIHL